MLKKAIDLLNNIFKYPSFRLEQERTIKTFLNKENVLAVMPTGGGKTICYQIPAILFAKENKGGVTIVISPLISLMKDQVKSATSFGIKSGFLNSTTNASDKKKIWNDLYNNNLEVLFISPEKAMNLLDFLYNQNIKVNSYAIDEAHCIIQWGHDFREDYNKVCQVIVEHTKKYKKEKNEIVPILALTATADKRTRLEISKQLNINSKTNMFVSSFYRPNIFISVDTKYGNGLHQLQEYLLKNPNKSGIIYCNTKKEAETIGRSFGFHVYHADQEVDYRTQIQNAFIHNNEQIIVATTAFGMGIDKPNIDFVYHTSVPYSLEDWYQQFGRVGRDGRACEVVVLFSPKDAIKIQARYEEMNNINAYNSLNAVIDTLTSSECVWKKILFYFDEDSHECNNCINCVKKQHKLNINTKELSYDIQHIVSHNKIKVGDITKILIGSRQIAPHLRTLKEYGKYKKNIYYDNKLVIVAFKEQIISNFVASLGLSGVIKKEIEPTDYNKFAFTYYLDEDIEKVDIHINNYINYEKVKELKKYAIVNKKISNLNTIFSNKKDNNKGSTVSSAAFYSNKKKKEGKTSYKIIEKIDVSNLDGNNELYLLIKEGRKAYAGEKKKYTQRRKSKMHLIMSEAVMVNISKIKPKNIKELIKVPGFGEQRANRHKKWILQIVNDYLNQEI